MHTVIIGNGIAGTTLARQLRKRSEENITLVSAETDYFFSRTALMYVYMGHTTFGQIKPYEDWFWEKNRISLKKGFVEKVDTPARTLVFADGETLAYDRLVLATGSTPNRFGWPGQDLKGVQGLYSYQDLLSMEACSDGLHHAVIVGGGLIGIEMAEMFLSRNIGVTFLVREKGYWGNVLPAEESDMVGRLVRKHGIDLRLETGLREILADSTGKARAAVTSSGEEIACGFVGLTAGVRPNIGFLKDSGIACNKGVLVSPYLETNVPGVFAIGDCAELEAPPQGRKAIEAVWYVGRMQGETLALTLSGKRTAYAPGPWFNSAKFFDMEYQTYGEVPPQLPLGWETLFWVHPMGEKSIRLVWDGATGAIKGFNLMGVRYRHETCAHWLAEGTHIHNVLAKLNKANFDPEFFKQYEPEVVARFNEMHPQNPVPVPKRKKFFGLV